MAFSFPNTQRTKVDLMVAEVRAPLVVVLLATAVAAKVKETIISAKR